MRLRHRIWQSRFPRIVPTPLLFVILLLARHVGGQTPAVESERRLKGLTLAQLGNIEVTTVSKKPVRVSQTPAAIFVITQDDIRRSGVTTIPEALRLAPGVDVASVDSVKWSVGIRGFESRLSRGVLVLIDGRSVYSPLFHGVYWEVQDTLLEDIERIEVIRGPGGTVWGANAVNGVINIITKHSRDTQGTLVSLGGGSVNQGVVDIRQGGSNGANLNWRIYAKGAARGPEFHTDNRLFDDWRRTQAGFRIDWDASAQDAVTFQGDFYTGEAGESIRITTLEPIGADVVDQDARLSGGNFLSRWRRTLKGGSTVEIQAYYDRANRRQSNQAEFRDTFDVDLVHHISLARRHEFTWGLGARISLGRVPTVVPTYVFTPSDRTDQLYTAYVQDEITLLPERLKITLGTKFLRGSYTGFNLEPGARLLWTPNSSQSFWLAVTRAVRTPSDNEDSLDQTTLRPDGVSLSRTRGDGNFVSETMVGYEAGYRSLLTSTFSMDFAAFYNNYDHLLSIEPGTPFIQTSPAPAHTVYPFTNGNGLRGITSGFEITPDWKPATWWRLAGSYSFLHMNLATRPGGLDFTTARNTVGASPEHQFTVQSFVDLPKHVEYSIAGRYVSEIRLWGVAGYGTIDSRIAWRPVPKIEFAVSGQNLLQPHHAEYGGDPFTTVGIRRNIFASITFRK